MKKQDAINGGKLRLGLERGAPVLHGQRFQRTGFLWGAFVPSLLSSHYY